MDRSQKNTPKTSKYVFLFAFEPRRGGRVYLHRHCFILHALVFCAFPIQGGFLHVRVFIVVPPPQVLIQTLQADHMVHPRTIERNHAIMCFILTV